MALANQTILNIQAVGLTQAQALDISTNIATSSAGVGMGTKQALMALIGPQATSDFLAAFGVGAGGMGFSTVKALRDTFGAEVMKDFVANL
jgi:hypothetical protein